MTVTARALVCLIPAWFMITCADGTAQPAGGEATAIAARIGDRAVTYAEVDQVALQQDAGRFRGLRLRDAIYEARRTALDTLIADRLLAAEAAREGQPASAIVNREVAAATRAVTDADVEGWFKANQARLNGATFASVSGEIRQGLEQQRREEARTRFIDRLRSRASVSILLPPPRESIRVASGEPSDGPENAAVQVVVYSDFQCPYCARVVPTMEKVKATYGDRLRIVFRHFPLTSIHPRAVAAATAAHCAHEQGRFWNYHDRLFASQGSMADADLLKHATDLGLDATTFTACTSGERVAAVVAGNTASGEALGVSSTPAFFVNGRFMTGAQPFEAFQRVIDEELNATAATAGSGSSSKR